MLLVMDNFDKTNSCFRLGLSVRNTSAAVKYKSVYMKIEFSVRYPEFRFEINGGMDPVQDGVHIAGIRDQQ